jgi:Zinc finger, C2H2 type
MENKFQSNQLMHFYYDDKLKACKICGQKFKNSSKINRHLTVHKLPPNPNFECSICKKAFRGLKSKNTHMQNVHKSKFHPTFYVLKYLQALNFGLTT